MKNKYLPKFAVFRTKAGSKLCHYNWVWQDLPIKFMKSKQSLINITIEKYYIT